MHILDILFPPHCAFCGNVTVEESGICPDCATKIRFIEGETCPKCGCKTEDCVCKGRSRYYTACTAPIYYDDNSKNSILRIKHSRKFSGKNTLARLVSASVKDKFEDVEFDCMAIVPMTSREKAKRGFNQSEILGSLIADNLGLKFSPHLLSKIYETKPQKSLKSYERSGNISGVFHISDPFSVRNKTVLLFDDIITTGNTVNECSKMLYVYGAEKIYVCSVLLTASSEKSDNTDKSENYV